MEVGALEVRGEAGQNQRGLPLPQRCMAGSTGTSWHLPDVELLLVTLRPMLSRGATSLDQPSGGVQVDEVLDAFDDMQILLALASGDRFIEALALLGEASQRMKLRSMTVVLSRLRRTKSRMPRRRPAAAWRPGQLQSTVANSRPCS